MSGNNNQKSVGYAILGVIIVFAIIGFFVSLTEKEDPKCAFAGCDNTVSTEGGYCYQHNTPGKRRKAAYGTSSSPSILLIRKLLVVQIYLILLNIFLFPFGLVCQRILSSGMS